MRILTDIPDDDIEKLDAALVFGSIGRILVTQLNIKGQCAKTAGLTKIYDLWPTRFLTPIF